MTTTRPDRRAERHARTRAEILDAAWSLSDERGLAGWSLRDVADVVGMRAPSLYVYVDSKNALYDAMFAQGSEQLLERIRSVPRTGAPRTSLRRGARAFIDFCVERPARHELLFLRTVPGFEPSPEAYAIARQALDETVEVLAAAGIRGQRTVDLWTALFSGLATQQLSNDPGGDRWTRLTDEAVDLLLEHVQRGRRRR